jgi:hypothetical protein
MPAQRPSSACTRIECIVQYRAAEGNQVARHGGGDPVATVDFIKKHFAAAKK